MDVPDGVLAGRVVLVIWHQAHTPEVMQPLLEKMMERVGETGRVMVENVERLIAVGHPQSSVDVVLSGYLPPPSFSHSSSFLAELARILKPSGTLILREPVTTRGTISGLRPSSKLTSALKLSGLVDVSEAQLVEPTPPDLQHGMKACGITVGEEELEGVAVAHVQAKKPSYEVGTSSQLSFASKILTQKKEQPKVSSETALIWSLSAADAVDDDLEDLVDSNTLLEEEDLLKPDPSTLRSDCGTGSGKKRKACKDCTCGLADEPEKEEKEEVQARPVTSSCGSCYLGDAFRCVSCPYLGMPAFKPGEQIRLSNRQLKADQ